MPKTQWARLLQIVPVATLSAWLAFGAAVFSQAAERNRAADADAARQSQQAAEAIVSLGKSSVLGAASDEDAISRAQMSIEALNIIGQLGNYDTSPQSDKLLDELASAARPAVTEVACSIAILQQVPPMGPIERCAKKGSL